MASPAELRRLAGPYRTRFAQLLTAADQTVARLYLVAGTLDPDGWAAVALPVVQGVQMASIGLAANYTRAQLAQFAVDTSTSVDGSDLMVDRSTRWLRSAPLREQALLAEGVDPASARVQAAGYAGDLMVAETRATERAAATAEYQAHWKTRRPLKYKRILESGACGWCRVVADRLYSADDPGKWHKHCRCTWRLITPDEAAAHEPQFDNDRWRDVIGERAQRPARSRRPATPDLDLPALQDPVPVPVRATPASRQPSQVVEWASPTAKRKYEPLLQGLDELHGVGDDLAATVVKQGGKTDHLGGKFSWDNRGPKPRRKRGESYDEYRTRRSEWIDGPRRDVITVHDRGDGTEDLSFLHEFGHRLDYTGSDSVFHSSTGARLSPEASEAMADLMTAMADTPTMVNAYRNFRDPAFVTYFRDPTEMWARAYSQWAANELGGPAREALERYQRLHPNHQWTDEEFTRLSPLLERVLVTRGMMA